MRIAFISVRPAYIANGTAHYDAANGRLIQGLNQKIEHFSLVAYQDSKQQSYYNTPIAPSKLYTYPWVGSYLGAFRLRKAIATVLQQVQQENDLLIVQLPFHAFWLLPRLYKPTIFHICANVVTAAQNPVKYGGWRGVVARFLARRIDRAYRKAMQRVPSRVIANGQELADMYPGEGTRAVVSTSLLESDIVSEAQVLEKWEQRAAVEAPELLFVGRPTLEKGGDLLAQALVKLKELGQVANLTVVGATEAGFWGHNAHVDELRELDIPIRFLGEVPFGKELFAIFDRADIVVLPSRNEGTPRVLVEARARGCIVVATHVGGIPTSVQHQADGWLVQPENAEALAEGIHTVWSNPGLRKELMVCGRNRVSSLTVNDFCKPFLDCIDELAAHE